MKLNQQLDYEPGLLRYRVDIESFVVSQQSDGFEEKLWSVLDSTLYQVPADISSEGGREFYSAKNINAKLSHEVVIRWRRGVTAEMRIRWDDPTEQTTRYFNITAVRNPDNRRRWLRLFCEELVGQEAQQ